jgi:hypothetical protein
MIGFYDEYLDFLLFLMVENTRQLHKTAPETP